MSENAGMPPTAHAGGDARPQVETFFDEASSTFTYLVLDRRTMQCALIDSVLDFDPKSGRTSTDGADRVIARVRELGATVQWLLETHVHADHLSAAPHLRKALGGLVAIGARITVVQETFGRLFNAGSEFARDGSQFDRLFEDGDRFSIGGIPARAMHTPGHTPACMTYVVGEGDETVAFVGDTLFMPDYGTARCDFPGGDAATLYRSIARVLRLPPATRLYMCHDYRPGGRPLRHVCTVAEQRAGNVHVHDGVTEAEFVGMRKKRDATLEMPTLILPSVQVNMRAGCLPPPEDNGVRYLKIPLDLL
ncbi:MBL fold metallo-hydrolase [Quisquiliibacterium transsilvanicum]|uniref:Glyoxylase-like metal-dependent hydrolase (Beta-lactamase superfamily II) n=1 Tax=Quisquiliibacterium transsilvanicum TaxID=1549638 RepID=A0A7W8HFS4_9BURK|nr:MBL fold metallo-hydrolase [Quisquiliibacterium transsilvanicum]MBB5270651.1 glyoxylase-like metal-dependent hydrolase (beta-lactamase superfamily II) [Quisquiliibacterium transsilvanicum]